MPYLVQRKFSVSQTFRQFNSGRIGLMSNFIPLSLLCILFLRFCWERTDGEEVVRMNCIDYLARRGADHYIQKLPASHSQIRYYSQQIPRFYWGQGTYVVCGPQNLFDPVSGWCSFFHSPSFYLHPLLPVLFLPDLFIRSKTLVFGLLHLGTPEEQRWTLITEEGGQLFGWQDIRVQY